MPRCKVPQRSFLCGMTLPTDCVVAHWDALQAHVSSLPGWNRLSLLPLLPGVTCTLNTQKATVVRVSSAFCVWAGFRIRGWLWCRGALARGVVGCCSDLHPAPSRLGMKMCHIPFHAPCQVPFSPSSTAHLWAALVFVWRQDVDLLSKKRGCHRVLLYLSGLRIHWSSTGNLLSRHTLV